MAAKSYKGGCHCGKVRFETTADPAQAISCNCSICQKHGLILSFVAEPHFKLLSGENDLGEYLFNKHAIHHRFCNACGVETFARGQPPGAKEPMIAVNVRCIDGIDVSTLSPKPFDGRKL